MQESTGTLLTQSIHLRGKRRGTQRLRRTEEVLTRYLYLPGAGFHNCLVDKASQFLVRRRDSQVPSLPYLVPPERSWHQVHAGNRGNSNANEILMTLKLATRQILVKGLSLAG